MANDPIDVVFRIKRVLEQSDYFFPNDDHSHRLCVLLSKVGKDTQPKWLLTRLREMDLDVICGWDMDLRTAIVDATDPLDI